jgi:hypothetical protein
MSEQYQQRSRKKWGRETDAAKRILEQVRLEAAQQGQAVIAPKKRRTKWAPQIALDLSPVPGIPGVQLPANIAAMAATIDPNHATLQLELVKVHTSHNEAMCPHCFPAGLCRVLRRRVRRASCTLEMIIVWEVQNRQSAAVTCHFYLP